MLDSSDTLEERSKLLKYPELKHCNMQNEDLHLYNPGWVWTLTDNSYLFRTSRMFINDPMFVWPWNVADLLHLPAASSCFQGSCLAAVRSARRTGCHILTHCVYSTAQSNFPETWNYCDLTVAIYCFVNLARWPKSLLKCVINLQIYFKTCAAIST